MLRNAGFPVVSTGFTGEWKTLSIIGSRWPVARGVWAGASGTCVGWDLVGGTMGAPGITKISMGAGVGSICITVCVLGPGLRILFVLVFWTFLCSLRRGCLV